MLDKATVTRRPLDFEDYTDILRRNVTWLIGPVFAGLVISTVVAFLLQDTYVSHALIRIVPQQISETLVQNTSSQDMIDRISGMAQTIESRTTLTNLIQTNDLYKSERKSEPLEDVINKMHEDIMIRPTMTLSTVPGKGLSMEVAFKYRDRMLAFKICQELVTRFMNLSTVDTMDSQTQAFYFLKGETEKAKADLDKLQQQIADYRTRHAGSLPEEMQGNFQQMTAVEQRLNSLSDAATRNSEHRMMLDTALRIAKDRQASIHAMTPTSMARSEKSNDLDKEITELETNIASMKDRYTADYPDLQAAQERLAVLRRERDESNKAIPAPKVADMESPATSRERLDSQGQVDAIQTQIKAANLEEQQLSQQILAANAQLRSFQGRLETSPAGETEYSDLLRDRENAKLKYLDLDARMHKSNMSMDLEKNKQGETLELIDNPSLPTEPTEPKRALIIPIGAVAGLALGIILVAVREVKDTSLKNLKDARVYTQLSILGSIPLLENDVVVQRRKQVMLVSWATATVLGIVIIVGSVAHYYWKA
jgi:polysaccharide chain length determinant protein (PEP-CTERM system associated)